MKHDSIRKQGDTEPQTHTYADRLHELGATKVYQTEVKIRRFLLPGSDGMPGETTEPGAEALEMLIVVGGATIAVVRRNPAEGFSEDTQYAASRRICVIEGGENAMPRDLAQIDHSVLTEPREDGAHQPFEVVPLGRDAINPNDGTISESHGSLTFTRNQEIVVEDHSTTGTLVFSAVDINRVLREEPAGSPKVRMMQSFLEALNGRDRELWQSNTPRERRSFAQGVTRLAEMLGRSPGK